jgi:hypothetical protein
VPGFEFGLDLVDGADLSKLNRPAFPKSREEKELEVKRVRELIDRDILVPRMRRTISWWGRSGTRMEVLGGCGARQNSGRSMW